MKIKKGATNRGFAKHTFKDQHDNPCYIQKSSLATDDCIWLGLEDGNPIIMCRDAVKLGLRHVFGDERDNGWCDYLIPKEVLISTSMHLTRKMVKMAYISFNPCKCR